MQDEDPNQQTETKLARWAYGTAGGYYWAGAYVCDEYLLVCTDDGAANGITGEGKLLCIDSGTGKLLSQAAVQGDARSSIAKGDDGKFYFTTKGGYFYQAAVTKSETGYALQCAGVKLSNGHDGSVAMSTSTPVIHNGRAYIGVCGTVQFNMYSGHNITVIDLNSMSIAYRVETKGYPQTSGLLTTAYDTGDGTVYVYFIDNYTPGTVRVLKDKPGQTQAALTQEENGKQMAYALFTPQNELAQYAICSPIVDRNGTMYFKNDSGYLMALGTQPKGDVNGDGVVDVYDLQRLYEHCCGINTFKGRELEDAGLADGEAVTQMQNLYAFLTTGRWDSSEKAG